MRRILALISFFLALVLLPSVTPAQSLTTGGVTGRITDPAGAIVPKAPVTLKSLDTGEIQTAATSEDGTYRFNLLQPGRYEVSANVTGFAKVVQPFKVQVGQTAVADFQLEISKTAETIEVTDIAPLISTDPGVSTSYTPMEVSLLPAAGGDITTLAFTAPGVVVAQGTGYGNFTVNGLPGTSNLYTVNGENDMDPYFNINNSGATNLTLGSNEVEELTVVTNPYSGQYGQLSGAQISYVTKRGSNAYHGNAQYYWNGRDLNANDFFTNAQGQPRPFSNANQWAASLGGPIVKDHTWFFLDTEGLRFILPNVYTETIPTPAFATAILNNIQNVSPSQLPVYQNMFNIYSKASAGKTLTAVPVVLPNAQAGTPGDECDTVSLPGWSPGATCANTFVSTPTSFAKEWTLTGRVDQKLTSKDDVFFRFKLDYGLQPTTVDPLSPAFFANSNQPAKDYQANWVHVFNSTMSNSLLSTASHYVAQFVQDAAAVKSEFPYGGVSFGFNDGFSGIDPQIGAFPQGRNVTQYQFVDDLSWIRGKHGLKFGVNFRRYDVSDHNFFNINPVTTFNDLTSTTLGANGMTGMQAFVNGLAQTYTQQSSPVTDVPIGIWGVGFYLEDSWKLTPHFTLTGALRFEKNANPVCNRNCLSNFTGPFPALASISSTNAGNVPYSSDFNIGLHNAFPGVDAINASPRLAFSWSPMASNKTVISGGVGIFYDNPAAGTLDNLLGNPPNSVLFNIEPLDNNNPQGTKGILPFANGPAAFAAASAAFNIKDSYNQLAAALNPIIGSTPPVSPTAIEGTIHSPQVQEWNLKVDQQLTKTLALSVSYNGNHSIHVLYYDNWWNAAGSGPFASVPGVLSSSYVNYGTVRTLQSGAVSNYNGLTGSLRVQYHSWLSSHINFTYSHALDETSNGGLFPIGGWVGGGNIQTQISPGSLRASNYGNADYDIRNLFNADYVITPPVNFGNKLVRGALGGWQWSGKVFARSGLPYSVTDGHTGGDLANGGIAMADVIAAGAGASCTGAAAYTNATITPCLNASAFATNVTAYTSYPSQTRNQFRGPDYVDFDMGLYKTFHVTERFNFGLGATAFNVFNHPNFNLPDTTLGSSFFGQVLSMQGVPTSPYGNFLGFDSSVRVVQLSLKLTF